VGKAAPPGRVAARGAGAAVAVTTGTAGLPAGECAGNGPLRARHAAGVPSRRMRSRPVDSTAPVARSTPHRTRCTRRTPRTGRTSQLSSLVTSGL